MFWTLFVVPLLLLPVPLVTSYRISGLIRLQAAIQNEIGTGTPDFRSYGLEPGDLIARARRQTSGGFASQVEGVTYGDF